MREQQLIYFPLRSFWQLPALLQEIKKQNWRMVDFIISKSRNIKDLNVYDDYGRSAVSNLIYFGKRELAFNLAFKHGTDISLDDFRRLAPYMFERMSLSTKQLITIFNRYIEIGGNKDDIILAGRGFAHCAVLSEDWEFIAFLKEQGVRFDLKDSLGNLPADYSLSNFDLFKFITKTLQLPLPVIPDSFLLGMARLNVESAKIYHKLLKARTKAKGSLLRLDQVDIKPHTTSEIILSHCYANHDINRGMLQQKFTTLVEDLCIDPNTSVIMSMAAEYLEEDSEKSSVIFWDDFNVGYYSYKTPHLNSMMGMYNSRKSIVVATRNRTGNEIKSTFVHELVHYILQKKFKNCANPFEKDSDKEQQFAEAVLKVFINIVDRQVEGFSFLEDFASMFRRKQNEFYGLLDRIRGVNGDQMRAHHFKELLINTIKHTAPQIIYLQKLMDRLSMIYNPKYYAPGSEYSEMAVLYFESFQNNNNPLVLEILSPLLDFFNRNLLLEYQQHHESRKESWVERVGKKQPSQEVRRVGLGGHNLERISGAASAIVPF